MCPNCAGKFLWTNRMCIKRLAESECEDCAMPFGKRRSWTAPHHNTAKILARSASFEMASFDADRVFGLYAEGVSLRSPGSRSAPWDTNSINQKPQRGFTDRIVKPLRGMVDVAFLTQGALCDPGLWSITASRYPICATSKLALRASMWSKIGAVQLTHHTIRSSSILDCWSAATPNLNESKNLCAAFES